MAVDAALAQFEDRLDRGDYFLAARLREQRAVIPIPEIGIILAQVDDLRALVLDEIRPRDELPVVQDQTARIAVAEVSLAFDDDDMHDGGTQDSRCVKWLGSGPATAASRVAGRPNHRHSIARCGR